MWFSAGGGWDRVSLQSLSSGSSGYVLVDSDPARTAAGGCLPAMSGQEDRLVSDWTDSSGLLTLTLRIGQL